jgi:hypothetical protein
MVLLVELTLGLDCFGGLGGAALHKGLESRGVGGDELCLDVGAFTSLVAMSLG